jgi:hypothetical protein
MSNNDSTWRFVAFGYALVGVIILILAASLFVEKAGATECQTLPPTSAPPWCCTTTEPWRFDHEFHPNPAHTERRLGRTYP